jgi:hypothetical protein
MDDPKQHQDVRLAVGTRLGPSLVVQRLVGQGGMGAVYLARDELLDRPVAVKVLHAGHTLESVSLRTLQEARAAARVVHPHVAAVHAIGEHAGLPFLEMEWVQGRSLRAVMRDGTPDRATLATWLAQLAAALTHAHAVGVVHCDVKPENVLIREVQGQPVGVKLVDFGLARNRRDGQGDRTLSQGTLAYLAPELAESPPSAASDQFALAMLAAELLLDQRPVRPRWTEAPELPLPCPLPMRAQEALQRGLNADPHRRFASANAFADALLRGLGFPHARAVAVPALAGPEAGTTTSMELPVPPLALAIPGLDEPGRILAVLAVLPPGYPGVLREALGHEPDADVLQHLVTAGKIEGAIDEWRLRRPEEREAALGRIPAKQRRLVCARVALAVEACGARRESTREDATRLHIEARRLGEAARLAFDSAAEARLARERDHHLARAASLLTSTMHTQPWLDALLRRCEWALRCGWLPIARGPLAEAQGVLADTPLPREHHLRIRAQLAGAELRALSGDLRGGLLQLQTAARDSTSWLTSLLEARAVTLLARAGDATALARGEAALAKHAHSQEDGAQQALSALHAACGEAALRRGSSNLAEQLRGDEHLQRALAIDHDRGDGLGAAQVEILLGDLHAVRRAWTLAEGRYREAEAMLTPLGAVEPAGRVQLRLGETWLKSGRPWPALRALGRAQGLFEEHGLPLHELESWRLLAEAATTLGDAEGAQVAAGRIGGLEQRLRRRR